jgi:uncharacterized MAPEG superfamily protein
MTPELTVLAYAGLLQVAQIIAYSLVASTQVSPKAAFGPRDKPIIVSGAVGRLSRAVDNHYSALILFTMAVVLIGLGDTSSPTTQTAAWVFLIARVLYVPAYVISFGPFRTVFWCVALGATTVMLIAGLP